MFKDLVLTILFSYSNNLVTQFGDILAEMLVNYLKNRVQYLEGQLAPCYSVPR